MQYNTELTTPSNTQNSWAFAVDLRRKQTAITKRGKSMMSAGRNFNSCVISAASREARALGVRAGMKYNEAKALVPDLRILICNR